MDYDDTTIFRAAKDSDNPYVMIRRSVTQDRDLSWEARGILCYLLSRPDNWVVRPTDLEQGCGREKVKRILDELIEAGHLTKSEQMTTAEGKFLPIFYRVHEVPVAAKPLTVQPLTANPPLTYTDEHKIDNSEGVPAKKRPSFWRTTPVAAQPVVDEKPAKPELIQYLEGRCGKLGKQFVESVSAMVDTEPSPVTLYAQNQVFRAWVKDRVDWYLSEARTDAGRKMLASLLRKYDGGPYSWYVYSAGRPINRENATVNWETRHHEALEAARVEFMYSSDPEESIKAYMRQWCIDNPR